MAYEFISVKREGRVMVLTIERPDVMNALHSPAHFECDDAFNSFAADKDLWIAIVTGAGDKAFSAGNDLKHHASGGSMAMPPKRVRRLVEPLRSRQADHRRGQRLGIGRRLRGSARVRHHRRLIQRDVRLAGT
jgi:enoyl-CoA hydratase/carnithine racemase